MAGCVGTPAAGRVRWWWWLELMRAVAAPAMSFAAEMLGLGRGAGLQLASEQVERRRSTRGARGALPRART